MRSWKNSNSEDKCGESVNKPDKCRFDDDAKCWDKAENKNKAHVKDFKCGKGDELFGIDKYLELIYENDEKSKFSHEIVMRNAAFELNYGWKQSIKNIENTHQRQKDFYRNNLMLFESKNVPLNSDFLKSFSEKQLATHENLPKSTKKIEESEKQKIRSVKTRKNEEKPKQADNPYKENPVKVIKILKKSSEAKKSKKINNSKAPPMILVKAESYLKKQSEKSSKVSPSSFNSHRYFSLESKIQDNKSFKGKNSPKNINSTSETYKKLEVYEGLKVSNLLPSPKNDQGTIELPAMLGSPAYTRAVSYRNSLKYQKN